MAATFPDPPPPHVGAAAHIHANTLVVAAQSDRNGRIGIGSEADGRTRSNDTGSYSSSATNHRLGRSPRIGAPAGIKEAVRVRVYISIDLEGVAGIATFDQIVRGGHGYPRAQRLMTGEANAAIAGVFDAGADQVLVNDSHGTMDNLLQDELDPRARLLIGAPKLDCMAEGLSSDHDIALFIGYHAAAGAPGVLAHTFCSHFLEVRLNGAPVSEAEVNALQAAALGVPVGLVTGDDVICALVSDRLPGAWTVPVKTAHGYSAADSLSPAEAGRQIRAAAAASVSGAGKLRPARVPAALLVDIDMPNALAAEFGAVVPGVERVGDRTLRYDAGSPREIVGFIMVAGQLAATAMQARVPLINRR
jgi:D-amino peptidase